MKIIIVRHGKTEWNTLEKAAGQVDIPLNEIRQKTSRRNEREISQFAN